MKFKLFERKRLRGKSKSPEAKFKEKQAQVNSFLLDSWLKKLKEDPALADRISEQRYGSETGMSRYDGEGYEGGGGGDLLEVLRQAKEAKELLRDEMGESKGNWLRDLAEIAKVLPSLLGALPQIQQVVQQQQQRTSARVVHEPIREQITETKDQPQLEPSFELSMEILVPLSELEPSDVWNVLVANRQVGWINYLAKTSLEQMEESLTQMAYNCQNADDAKAINEFIATKHHWLAQLVEIAHNSIQKES